MFFARRLFLAVAVFGWRRWGIRFPIAIATLLTTWALVERILS